jgi:hypothetical protein
MQTMTGSPLSAIAGLGALAGGLFSKNASGTSAAGNLYGAIGAPVTSAIGGAYDWAKNAFGGGTNAGTTAATNTTGSMGDTGANVRGGSSFGGTGSGIEDPNQTSGAGYTDPYYYGDPNSLVMSDGANYDYIP